MNCTRRFSLIQLAYPATAIGFSPTLRRVLIILLAGAGIRSSPALRAAEQPSSNARTAAIEKLQAAGAALGNPNAPSAHVDLAPRPDRVVDFTEDILRALQALPEMEWLRLSATGVTDDQLARLPLENLKYLNLSDNPISDKGLKRLRSAKALERLNLSKTAITSEGLAAIVNLGSLIDLILDNTDVADAAAGHLIGLSNLTCLSLNNTKIGDVGLEQIGKLPGLQRLDLSATEVTDAGMRHLAGSARLRIVVLSHTEVGDAGVKQLAGLAHMECIDLAGTRVSDASAAVFAGWPRLFELNLAKTRVTDEVTKPLRGHENLTELSLQGTRISDAALRPLADIEFRKLNLADTAITKTGLVYLEHQPLLRELNLSRTKIGDSLLEPLKNLPQLRKVDVSGTDVTALDLFRAVPRTSPRTLAILEALQERTEADFVQQPLCDVIEYLRQRHEIEIQPNYKSLKEVGARSDTLVTCLLRGLTLTEALEKMLDPLKLTFSVRHEVLVISARPAPEPVADLPVVPSGERLSPALAETFMQRTELDFADQPWSDVIEFLAMKHGLKIRLDATSLTAAGIGTDVPVTRSVKGITLKSALELILDDLGLTCLVEGGKVVIRAK